MYKEGQLITTKFNIPTVGSKTVKRPRLFKKLDSCFDYRLTLVTAPAGYGKTTLVTSWLSEKKKRKLITTWLSLDEDDNDPECFWSYFFMSLYKKMPGINDIRSEGAMFNKLYISHFINTVCKFDGEILMVIDDFNIITNDIILKNIKFLIKNMPLNMYILILSRAYPKVKLSRFRAADSILEINKYDLQFTYEETVQFVCKALDDKAACDKCSEIWKEAEGWAAGIQMRVLTIKNFGEKSLNNNFVFKYMMEEVFLSLNENTKKFLMYTSIVDEFSVELGNYLLEINNSIDIIKEVEVLDLFLITLDGEKKWFRYHNLFRSFLKKQLGKLNVDIIHRLLNRAAKWYEDNKQTSKAVENYISGKNFKKAVKLIEGASSEILCSGQAKLLGKWNKMLPKDIFKANYRLIMNSAWAASADGKTSEASKYIMMVQDCPDMYRLAKAEIAALTSTNIVKLNNIDKIIDDCKNFIKGLKPKEFLRQLMIFNIAKEYLFKGEIAEAEYYLKECLKISIETGKEYTEVAASKLLLIGDKLRGNYRQSEKKCKELISKLKIDGDILLPAAGLLYAELSDIYYEWNELEKAEVMAKEGLRLGLTGEDTWTITENYFMLVKTYKAMELSSEYKITLNKLKKYFAGSEFFDMKLKLEIFNIGNEIKNGEIMKASKGIINISHEIKGDMTMLYPEFYIAKVKLCIHAGKMDKARKILNIIQSNAEKYNANALLIKVMILNSMFFEKIGHIEEAISELEKAVILAWKQKLVRSLIDEGKWMEAMLRRIKKNTKSDDICMFIDVLLTDFKPNFRLKAVSSEEILSKREIEIIKLICNGATNLEIAQKLFVSVNTVKTHLLNIYTKLDVHSRTRAVARAKNLKLI